MLRKPQRIAHTTLMNALLYSVFLVFVGGGLGSVARYGVGLLIQPYTPRFPLATLLANVAACLLLGILTGLQLRGQLDESRRLLLATGFCGGFSTFSTFTNDTWSSLQNGQTASALLNVFLNLAVCFFSLLLGAKIGIK
jgi:CrcB protein